MGLEAQLVVMVTQLLHLLHQKVEDLYLHVIHKLLPFQNVQSTPLHYGKVIHSFPLLEVDEQLVKILDRLDHA